MEQALVTKNSNIKRAARAYQDAHPEVTYPAAKRIVQNAWAYVVDHQDVGYSEALRMVVRPHNAPATPNPYDDDDFVSPSIEVLLAAALAEDEQLLDHELSIVPPSSGLGFYVDLGPDVEEDPIDVDAVDIDTKTLNYDIHEEFDGGTVIGEVRVEADISWSGCVFKATYYGAADDVPWHVTDHDWNDHYVRVAGEIHAELVYSFQHIELEDGLDELTLLGLEHLQPRVHVN